MKEFKGTKGKWELVKEGMQKHIKCGNRYIAEVWYGNEEHNSNAKLIASAPEMFEMLKDAKAEFGEYHFMYNAIEQLLTKITE